MNDRIPPDLQQCQAEKPGGVRCTSEPTVIATERRQGQDGWRKSLALCPECLAVHKQSNNLDYAAISTITGPLLINIYDWSLGNLLHDTPYVHDQVIGGTETQAIRIAGEIFSNGANVMMIHRGGNNVGTRKNPKIAPKGILIQADSQRFQQR